MHMFKGGHIHVPTLYTQELENLFARPSRKNDEKKPSFTWILPLPARQSFKTLYYIVQTQLSTSLIINSWLPLEVAH